MISHPKHLPAEERRAVTVESVVELAATQNPSEITTTAIAKHMGVTQGALFKHFPNKDAILQALCRIVADGRERGEFERKTPLDEVCRAIFVTTSPFCHPVMLEQTPREEIAVNAAAVSSLVLRSLSP